MAGSTLDAATEAQIKSQVMPMITGVAATAAVALVAGGILALIGVNMKKSTMAGDNDIGATKSGSSACKVDTNAKGTGAGLRDDALSASKGNLNAQSTNAAAVDSDAKAADTGASAARPKAGALDVQTKAMNIT
jgi:hypothetical protein